MTVLIGLLAFFLLLDIAAVTGWAPSTRDGRDWQRDSAADASAPRHAQPPSGVVSGDSGGSRPGAACESHAIAA